MSVEGALYDRRIKDLRYRRGGTTTRGPLVLCHWKLQVTRSCELAPGKIYISRGEVREKMHISELGSHLEACDHPFIVPKRPTSQEHFLQNGKGPDHLVESEKIVGGNYIKGKVLQLPRMTPQQLKKTVGRCIGVRFIFDIDGQWKGAGSQKPATEWRDDVFNKIRTMHLDRCPELGG